jgi:hypothetical protein
VLRGPQIAYHKKSICERRQCSATCGAIVTRRNHECNQRYCETCNQKRDVGRLYFIRPLKDVLPNNADSELYVFYDFETTQNKRYSDTAKAHEPKIV